MPRLQLKKQQSKIFAFRLARVRIAGKRKTLFRRLRRDLSVPPFLMQFELSAKKRRVKPSLIMNLIDLGSRT
jgi:hypothetical protein